MLPVRAGDLTLTTGTWHLHFDHKTQKPGSIWSAKRGDLLSSYPATSAASKNLLLRFEMPDGIQDRACITLRRIEHHNKECVEQQKAPTFSSASASSASVGAVPRVVGHIDTLKRSNEPIVLPEAAVRVKIENANFDLSCDITEPSVATVAKASAEQLTSHTDDGNKLCVTVIQDVYVWLVYLANVIDNLESMLERTDSREQAAIHSRITELYNAAQTWQNKKAVAELSLEAHQKLQELQS